MDDTVNVTPHGSPIPRADPAPPMPQAVDAPLTGAAVFLTLTVVAGEDAVATVRSVLADLGGLAKTVGFRDPTAALAVTAGIGAAVWPRLVGGVMPAQLRPFREVRGATHTAPATPGDLLVHIRAERADLCFEFERLLLDALGAAVHVEDETVGFRYFDSRDVLGFVDGTANPVGPALSAATLVGDDDPAFAGGSYLVVQKYLHAMAAWNAMSTEEQERIIGRTKLDNVELDDAGAEEQKSHKTLATIEVDGVEHDILRDNMPFGRPGAGEFGTYFIGYARELWVIERMLERMFVGDPPGRHDRILDVSTAVTGATFFVPAVGLLDGLADGPAPVVARDPAGAADHSLGLGSLRAPSAPHTEGTAP